MFSGIDFARLNFIDSVGSKYDGTRPRVTILELERSIGPAFGDLKWENWIGRLARG